MKAAVYLCVYVDVYSLTTKDYLKLLFDLLKKLLFFFFFWRRGTESVQTCKGGWRRKTKPH